MKIRILALLLCLVTVFSFSACVKAPEGDGTLPGTGSAPSSENTTASGTTPEPEKDPVTVALDLTAEWNKVTAANSLVQGCVAVRTEFLNKHPDAVANFLKEYKASISYMTDAANLDAAAQMIVNQGIFTSAPVAKKALPKCNVRYMDGADMKTAMNTYLEVLKSVNPKAIGGSLPGDDFYYPATAEASGTASGTTIRVYTLNGTTGFGMAKLMEDAANGSSVESYEFSVKADASVVTSALINGDVDIAALPTNAASNLYNVTNGGVRILAVNTLGCLYLLTGENTTVTSFADLKGKTVYVPAQNPTFIFTYLCRANGLEVGKDVVIDSTTYAVAANLKDAVAQGLVEIAVLPEPMVTIAVNAAKAQQ